jgi:DNA-directed RNA polymerase specialized sigma24 family protein
VRTGSNAAGAGDLAPAERAVFVLREVFDVADDEIADAGG